MTELSSALTDAVVNHLLRPAGVTEFSSELRQLVRERVLLPADVASLFNPSRLTVAAHVNAQTAVAAAAAIASIERASRFWS